MAEKFVVGPEPQPYLDEIRAHVAAGYDHIVLMNCGPDPDGFFDFFTKEIRDRVG